MLSRHVISGHNSSDRVLSRLFQPSSRDRVLSRYVSAVIEIVCCFVMSAQ